MNGDYSDGWNKLESLYEDGKAKIVPVKFIPQYQAKTPEEKGRLKQNFVSLMNHINLEAVCDIDVEVSQEADGTYLKINPKSHYSNRNGSNIEALSPGKDGTQAKTNVKFMMDRQPAPGCVKKGYRVEITIDDNRYVIPEWDYTIG